MIAVHLNRFPNFKGMLKVWITHVRNLSHSTSPRRAPISSAPRILI
jgi:hypothetical protein